MDSNKKIGKWKASRVLFSKSWEIFKEQKNLVMFPVWSFLTSIVALIVIGLLTLISTIGTGFLANFSEISKIEEATSTSILIGGIIVTIVLQIIATYFNAGIIKSTNEYLSGNKIDNKKSLRAINKKKNIIFGWAVINASVGIILRQISERSKILGKIVTAIMGAAWSITTYFMLPILVIEDIGIKLSGKKSVNLIRKTWGEAFLTNVGVGLAMAGFVFLGIIPMVLAILSGSLAVIVIVGILFFIYIIGISLISSVLNTIIKVILYRYASGMLLPESINTEVINSIFKKN